MSYFTNSLKASLLTGVMLGGALLSTSALAHETDRSDDIVETHNVSDFRTIEIRGVYELDVKVGPDFSVVTSGAAKEVDGMKVFVRGDTLVLDSAKKKKRMNKRHGVLATITLPALDGLDVVGVGTGDITGIDADDFSLDVSGVGEIDLSGSCTNLRADVSGVGDFSTENLICETAKADISGVGEFSVYASESADVSAMGIGQVEVFGNPKELRKDSSFLSKVRIK